MRAQRDAPGPGDPRHAGPDGGAGHAAGGICVELLTFFAGSYRRVFGFDAPPLHDPVAVARVIDPTIVTTVEANVAVELTGTHARVAVGLDAGRFWELVVAAVAALG